MIIQLIINSFILGATIALMAVGFTLIFGILRVINFWHGEAYMLGATFVFYSMTYLGVSYWWALVVAVIAVGAIGYGLYWIIFRRFQGNLMGGVIAGIALSLATVNSMWYIIGPRPRPIQSVIKGTVEIFGGIVSWERIMVFIVSISLISILAWFIKYNKFGRAMRAVQQDPEAAASLGINVSRIYGITFAISASLASVAGGLMAPIVSLTPTIGIQPLTFAFIVVILGGMGSVTGAFIASFIIGFQQSFTAAFWGSEYALAVSFGLAIIVLIVRPSGLLGKDSS